jgi:3-isopropylmalate dehydratase small subunit
VKDALAARNELTVDLEHLEISHPEGLRIRFAFDAHAQERLVQGLDDVARTLAREAEIAAFEARYTPRFDLARIP